MADYIHYGAKKYDESKFQKIKNRELCTKPYGGLWASSIDADFGWKDWCKANEYSDCIDGNSFIFTLKPKANILCLKTVNDLRELPKLENYGISHILSLDFEKIMQMGVDAIEFVLGDGELYFPLYGWDCDSILVLNKDIIISQ